MTWLLNTLHADLSSRTSKKSSSIIHKCFQGELEVVKVAQSKAISEKKQNREEQNGALKITNGEIENNNNVATVTYRMPFLMLGLDLPEPPLFKDVMPFLMDYVPLAAPTKENEKLRTKYDLIASIVHDGKPDEGFYRVFVQRKSEELWYEMQDLHVSETLPQMLALSEAYMQICFDPSIQDFANCYVVYTI